MKKIRGVGCQWLTPVILVIQEAEIRRIAVSSQPGEILHEIPKQTTTKIWLVE
jgi:hypothetical protein